MNNSLRKAITALEEAVRKAPSRRTLADAVREGDVSSLPKFLASPKGMSDKAQSDALYDMLDNMDTAGKHELMNHVFNTNIIRLLTLSDDRGKQWYDKFLAARHTILSKAGDLLLTKVKDLGPTRISKPKPGDRSWIHSSSEVGSVVGVDFPEGGLEASRIEVAFLDSMDSPAASIAVLCHKDMVEAVKAFLQDKADKLSVGMLDENTHYVRCRVKLPNDSLKNLWASVGGLAATVKSLHKSMLKERERLIAAAKLRRSRRRSR